MFRDDFDRSRGAYKTDLNQFLLGLRKIWRQVLLLCAFSVLAGFLLSQYTYEPAYTAETTFVVSNKSTGVPNDSQTLSLGDINASTALANTFKYVLLSDEAMKAIISTYQLDLSVDGLKRCISVMPVPNTNILEMTVTTHDAVLSRDIADKIIAYYPRVLERTLKNASLEVLNPPQIPQTADSYRGDVYNPLLGLLAALFLSFLFVYLRLVFRDTVRTASDFSDRLGLDLLASIPKVRTPARRRKARKWLYITDKANGFAFTESYKALRTKIQLAAEKKGYKTFIVTSALENEGKTTASVNLAIALAENNRRVLLIDADLRKPSVYSVLGRAGNPPECGLDRVLEGKTAVESAVVNIVELGLSALLNTKEFLNSSELLSSSPMKALITRVCEQYDYIIIDASPASVLTDSVVMTAYTDAVIMVVRQDHAAIRLVDSTAKSLSENKAELLGCIFNIVDAQGFDYGKYTYRYSAYSKSATAAAEKSGASRKPGKRE